MSPDDQNPDPDLAEEALSLLLASSDLPEAEREQRLLDWGRQSSAHKRALETAQHEWDLLGELDDAPLRPTQRVQLAAESVLASAVDHPGRAAGALALAAVLSVSPLMLTSEPSLDPEWMQLASHEDSFERHATQGREQRELVLSTGARVWLNWNSEVRIAEHDDMIHVEMIIGDALFVPAQIETKPMLVRSGEVVAYAPKTEFAIHSHGPQDAFFQVRSGSVTLGDPETSSVQKLDALEQTYVFEGASGQVRPANVKTIAAWQNGKVILEDRPLLEVIYELTHYTDQKITVGVLTNADETVSIDVNLEDADEALAALANDFELEFVKDTPGSVMIRSLDGRRL